MISDEEPGVCVCCRAAADLMFGVGDGIPVCSECKADGTFLEWLEVELEKTVSAAGYSCRVDENGKRLWTSPPAASP